ncbi:MAG: ferritin family protein [Sedimentisphaerales bacterium]|nr:ferritin family protein [Sedimentisphaerales bacterium]
MSQSDKNRGILEFAVTQEDRDHEFFLNLARHADQSEKRELFERLAAEELNHKNKLAAMIADGTISPASLDDSAGTGLFANGENVQLDPKLKSDFRNILANAIKREQKSSRFYEEMAAKMSDDDARQTFLTLASEEANHQLLLQNEFDCLS